MGSFLSNEAHEAEQGGGAAAGAFQPNEPKGSLPKPQWNPPPIPQRLRQGQSTQNSWDTSTDRFSWMGDLSPTHF